MEFVVFFASFKYFFVEGGEQFIVGMQTAKKIGTKPTIKITLMGITFATTLYFLLFYSRILIPVKILELMLALGLFYFSAHMLKEAVTGESKDAVKYKYGYTYIVSLESIENSSALASLTFVDISGALVGAFCAIGIFIILALRRGFLERIPVAKLRLVSGILLAITATPLIFYSLGLPAPDWMRWIIPPLG